MGLTPLIIKIDSGQQEMPVMPVGAKAAPVCPLLPYTDHIGQIWYNNKVPSEDEVLL